MPQIKDNTVKVAAVQAVPVALNLAENLKKVNDFTAEAAREGVDLVVFP